MFYPNNDFSGYDSEGIACPLYGELQKSEIEPTPDINAQNELMKKIQEVGFAVTDMNLFLDTHPNCTQALELYAKLCATLNSLKNDYRTKYGPLCATDSTDKNEFEWVKIGYKWPWE